MKFITFENLSLGLITAILMLSIFIKQDMRYIFIILILLTGLLFVKSRNEIGHMPFFVIVIIDSFSSWFISEWLTIIIMISGFGLYLHYHKKFNTTTDILNFIIFAIIILLCGVICSSLNHTYLPFLIMMGAILLMIIISIVYEFRLISQFSGEKNEDSNKR